MKNNDGRPDHFGPFLFVISAKAGILYFGIPVKAGTLILVVSVKVVTYDFVIAVKTGITALSFLRKQESGAFHIRR